MSLFGERLHHLRKSRQLSLEELGKKIGVAKSTVAGYEKGFREPDMDKIQLLAIHLRTTADYLLGLTDSETPAYALPPSVDFKDVVGRVTIHWDGVVLQEEDVALLKTILQHIVRQRQPQAHNVGESQ